MRTRTKRADESAPTGVWMMLMNNIIGLYDWKENLIDLNWWSLRVQVARSGYRNRRLVESLLLRLLTWVVLSAARSHCAAHLLRFPLRVQAVLSGGQNRRRERLLQFPRVKCETQINLLQVCGDVH